MAGGGSRGIGVARASAMLIALTGMSQVLGYVRDAVIAAVFGAGDRLDAYLVAQGLLNLVITLGAAAVARAIVPPVTRAFKAGQHARVEGTVQSVVTLSTLTVLTGAAIVFAAAEPVVSVVAPGFDEDTQELAAALTRILLAAGVFVALTDILAATAQAHGRFFLSGLQGLPFNLAMIAAAAGLSTVLGIYALAIGFVAGSALRMVLQLPALRAEGIRLRPRLSLDGDVREVLRFVPALLVGSAAVNVNTLVDRAVGSAQGDGVVTALSFGWRIVTLVDMLLVVTVVAALYPAFSAVGADTDRTALRQLVGRASRTMLVLLAPAVAILAVAAEPIVALLFGRGDFDATAVEMTATAVAVYAVSAVAVALRSIASRACLSVGDSRTPVAVAVVTMLINVAGDLTLGVAYGIPGLAASTSVSLGVGAVLLLILLARRHGAVALGPLAAAAVRVTAAAGLGAAAAVVAGTASVPAAAGEGLTALRTALTAVVVAAVYAGVLVAVRSPELRDTAGIVRDRLLRRGAAR